MIFKKSRLFSPTAVRLFIAAFVCLTGVLAATPNAECHGYVGTPDVSLYHFTIGPSVAYSRNLHDKHGLALGLDTTIAVEYTWLSVGFRSNVVDDARVFSPYVEAGGWFLVNLGAGYNYNTLIEDDPVHGFHLFLGLPIGTTEGLGFMVEPYYRPGWAFGSKTVFVQEVGVMAKFVLGFGKTKRCSASIGCRSS